MLHVIFMVSAVMLYSPVITRSCVCSLSLVFTAAVVCSLLCIVVVGHRVFESRHRNAEEPALIFIFNVLK